MGHGAAILPELQGSDDIDIVDALDRSRDNVRGKFLVAENGQPFLKA